MTSPKQQRGSTLIVGIIMLIVITLLVVYSIRAGNTNLRIAGNMQFQAEAFAATQQGVERVIDQIRTTDLIASIPAQTIPVTINGLTYNVQTSPMTKCLMDVPVLNTSLNPAIAEDVACFENPDTDRPVGADGLLATTQSACKNQVWEVQANVTETMSGASMTQVQGVAIRVPSTVSCS